MSTRIWIFKQLEIVFLVIYTWQPFCDKQMGQTIWKNIHTIKRFYYKQEVEESE